MLIQFEVPTKTQNKTFDRHRYFKIYNENALLITIGIHKLLNKLPMEKV